MELKLYDIIFSDEGEKYLIGTMYDIKLANFVSEMLNKVAFEENTISIEVHNFDDTNRVSKLMKEDEETGQLMVYQAVD